VADYSDQEQAERLLAWWRQYGPSVLVGVAIGFALLFGYRYWTQHQENQRVQASVLYEQLQAMRTAKPAETVALAKRLREEFAGTPYAGLAALMQARVHYETGDRAAAREALQWATANAHSAVAHAARLRLARLLLEDHQLDAVQALIEVRRMDGFDAEYHELRGDLLLARRQPDAARAAYREALRQAPPGSGHARLLSLKLDDLGSEEKR
jgi:predicted negative regulator of RcsB-dependent stress response